MNVLIEASNLGIASAANMTRTGILRASEELLRALNQRGDCSLRLAAVDSYIAQLQLYRYQRSPENVSSEVLSAWSSKAASDAEAMALVDALGEVEEFRPAWASEASNPAAEGQAKRLRAELALIDRLAEPRALGPSFDIFHSLRAPLAPTSRVDAKVRLLNVYDCVPKLFPEWCAPQATVHFDRMLASLDEERDWVVCNSEATRLDFLERKPGCRDRVAVLPLAADRKRFFVEDDAEVLTQTLAKYGLAKPFVLSVSTIEPRKNLCGLIEAFALLQDDARNRDLVLVLTGPEGWRNENLRATLARYEHLSSRIVFTGFVTDRELRALYGAADCVALPSFHEGFGLPALEAMQCGAPVVTSRTSSLPEVVGDAALLVDPEDHPALAEAMRSLLWDPDLRTELRSKALARSQQFSWEHTAAKMIAIYKNALEGC